jgi:cytochrome c oxidase subunit 3
MANLAHSDASHYYVPEGSHWPLVGSVGLTLFVVGFAFLLNGTAYGGWLMVAGFIVLVYMMFGWFGAVAREHRLGLYNAQVGASFRIGMVWFIFSEVMFFAAFFGALYYARQFSVPWLGGADNNAMTHAILWNGYDAAWPTNGPGAVGGSFHTVGAWGIPALNTAILLTSGLTLTVAHWALKKERRRALMGWLAATIGLGMVFVGLQAYEYIHAHHEMNLTVGSGIYGSTFYMLTGFHGLHVTVGAIILTVMLIRAAQGAFTPKTHFGFEASAWYWHFVDMVWLILFVFVYWI